MTIYKLKRAVVVTAVAAGISLALSIILYADSRSRLAGSEVIFLDVGQGDSILIKTRYGQNILIDGGPNSGTLGKIGSNLAFYDRTLDMVVATHPDLDHIGGLPEILDRYRIGFFLESGAKGESEAAEVLGNQIDKNKIARQYADSRIRYEFGPNVHLDILYPLDSYVGKDPEDTNEASIVAIFKDGETSWLLTGDLPLAREELLVKEYGSKLDVTILKAGHHGSKNSTGRALLEAATPEAVVISAGKDNSYGHPHYRVLYDIAALGIPSLRTDESGDIRFVSDGEYAKLR